MEGGRFGIFRQGSVSGLGDLFLNPLLLNWQLGDHHFTFAPGISAPIGKYDADKLLNLSRNHWAFDLAGSYTWFHPTRGHEISITPGFLLSTENPDTDYTGIEFHLDWLVGQYFSEHFGVGVNGYYYQQITADDGQVAGNIDVSNFRDMRVGIGPAVLVSFPLGSWTPLNIIGKALFDVASEDHFDGNLFMVPRSPLALIMPTLDGTERTAQLRARIRTILGSLTIASAVAACAVGRTTGKRTMTSAARGAAGGAVTGLFYGNPLGART